MECRSRLPLLVQRPVHGPQGQAVLALLTPAAALFEGDEIDLTVECGRGCDVTLCTTGATRLNRCRASPILTTIRASVRDGAILRYLPHELLPYAGTRYRQHLELDVECGASAQVLEVIAPGRSGAAFSYSLLELTTILREDGVPSLREHFRLSPSTRTALRGFTHYGSLLTLGAQLAAPPVCERSAGTMQIGTSTFGKRGTVRKVVGHSASSVRGHLLAGVPVSPALLACLPP